jgi:hypothetical protein
MFKLSKSIKEFPELNKFSSEIAVVDTYNIK